MMKISSSVSLKIKKSYYATSIDSINIESIHKFCYLGNNGILIRFQLGEKVQKA